MRLQLRARPLAIDGDRIADPRTFQRIGLLRTAPRRHDLGRMVSRAFARRSEPNRRCAAPPGAAAVGRLVRTLHIPCGGVTGEVQRPAWSPRNPRRSGRRPRLDRLAVVVFVLARFVARSWIADVLPVGISASTLVIVLRKPRLRDLATRDSLGYGDRMRDAELALALREQREHERPGAVIGVLQIAREARARLADRARVEVHELVLAIGPRGGLQKLERLGRGLDPLGYVLLEQGPAQPIELRWHVVAAELGDRPVEQLALELLRRRTLSNRWLAREQLVQKRTGPVQIVLRADPTQILLGRHVAQRADRTRDPGRLRREAGDPEIRHAHLAVGRDENVPGIDVAVHDPDGRRADTVTMRRMEHTQDRAKHVGDDRDREPLTEALGQTPREPAQVHPVHEVHHQVQQVAPLPALVHDDVLAEVVHRDDEAMVAKLRPDRDFSAEHRARIARVGQLRLQDLQGVGARRVGLDRGPNLAHPATPDEADEAVAADRLELLAHPP